MAMAGLQLAARPAAARGWCCPADQAAALPPTMDHNAFRRSDGAASGAGALGWGNESAVQPLRALGARRHCQT